MWAKHDNGSDVDWDEATTYCRSLKLGGYPGWRLPSIEELQGIYNSAAGHHIEGGITLTGFWPWSATKEGSGSAWYFDFRGSFGGDRNSNQLDHRYYKRALCVRRSR
jgi:formylglycine-generating enzyme required for sulfatase activity